MEIIGKVMERERKGDNRVIYYYSCRHRRHNSRHQHIPYRAIDLVWIQQNSCVAPKQSPIRVDSCAKRYAHSYLDQ